MRGRAPTLVAMSFALGGCTVAISQDSFFPQTMPAPAAALTAPPGYTLEEAMIVLPSVGTVHVVRLDNPTSEATLIYSGGNGSFVAGQSQMAAALADAAKTDIILYDYPGRGGTTVPPTIDASLAAGPALLDALRARGWIGRTGLFAYGLSFGGSQAAAMVRNGGFDGLIIEGSAADIPRIGRGFVPALLRPFLRLRVDPVLARFRYADYAIASGAPILLVSSVDDRIVAAPIMRDFAEDLRAKKVDVTFVSVPGGHGSALDDPAARAAVTRFLAAQARPAGG